MILLISGTIAAGQDIIPEPPDPQSGYINLNEFTGAYGLGSTDVPYSKYFYGLTTIHGYEFNIKPFNINTGLAVGAGAGMLFYGDGTIFPLFLDLRYTLNFNKISPFVFGSGGLLLNFDDLNELSKLYANAGAGLKIKISSKVALNIGPGLLVQFGKDDSRDAFVNLKAGVSFKPGARINTRESLVLRGENLNY